MSKMIELNNTQKETGLFIVEECKSFIVKTSYKNIPELVKEDEKYGIGFPDVEFIINCCREDGKYKLDFYAGFENYGNKYFEYGMLVDVSDKNLKEYVLDMLESNLDNIYLGEMLKVYLEEFGIEIQEGESIMNKNFAMELSKLLNELSYEEGLEVIGEFFDGDLMITGDTTVLDGNKQYEHRYSCNVCVSDLDDSSDCGLLEKHGIVSIYYLFNINATLDEMVALLEDYGEYQNDMSEEEVKEVFGDLMHRCSEGLGFDEILETFGEVEMQWDITVENGGYYRDGKLMREED